MKYITSLFVIAAASLNSATDSNVEAGREQARGANSRGYAAEIRMLTSRIDSFVAEELVKNGAAEFPPARRYAMRDLDGDKKSDLFLITTFESPDANKSESHFFAVLTSRPDKVHHILIGESGQRMGDHFRDNGEALFLQLMIWAKTDSQAGPNLVSTEEVYIEAGCVFLKPFDAIKVRDPK